MDQVIAVGLKEGKFAWWLAVDFREHSSGLTADDLFLVLADIVGSPLTTAATVLVRVESLMDLIRMNFTMALTAVVMKMCWWRRFVSYHLIRSTICILQPLKFQLLKAGRRWWRYLIGEVPMVVTFVRIDDRTIYGQTVTRWAKENHGILDCCKRCSIKTYFDPSLQRRIRQENLVWTKEIFSENQQSNRIRYRYF